MTTGRRPSGLCGAAILISARYHGFKRSIKQIVDVVHVCDETIRRRLVEFSLTPIAKLTKNEFDTFIIPGNDCGMDPPAFLRNRKKELEKLHKDKENINNPLVKKAREIEKMIEEPIDNVTNMQTTQDNSIKIRENVEKTVVTSIIEEEPKEMFEDAQSFLSQFKKNKVTFNPNIPFINLPSSLQTKIELKEDDTLSDIEETDLSKYILTNEEYTLKKMLWEVLYSEWIEEQKEKKLLKQKEVRKIRKASKAESSSYKDPIEAILGTKKFNNANAKKLEKIFQK